MCYNLIPICCFFQCAVDKFPQEFINGTLVLRSRQVGRKGPLFPSLLDGRQPRGPFLCAAGVFVSGAPVFVLLAGMIPAGMPLLMMVVAAMDVRIIRQITGQIRLDGLIRRSGYPAEQLDFSLFQGGLGSAPDPTTNQDIHAGLRQKSGQGPVALPLGVHDLTANNLPIFHIIEFELLRVSEMLKNHAILIRHCYPHLHLFLV